MKQGLQLQDKGLVSLDVMYVRCFKCWIKKRTSQYWVGKKFAGAALFGQKNVILVFESVWDVRQSCIGLWQVSEDVLNDTKSSLYQISKFSWLLPICLLLKKVWGDYAKGLYRLACGLQRVGILFLMFVDLACNKRSGPWLKNCKVVKATFMKMAMYTLCHLWIKLLYNALKVKIKPLSNEFAFNYGV